MILIFYRSGALLSLKILFNQHFLNTILENIGDLQTIRNFALDRIEALQRTAEKTPPPYEMAREYVERGRSDGVLFFRGSSLMVIKDLYVPAVNGNVLRWGSKVPVYRDTGPTRKTIPAGYIALDEEKLRVHKIKSWGQMFSEETRTPTPAYTIAGDLQRELDSCGLL